MRRSTYGFCHGERGAVTTSFDAHRPNSIAEGRTIRCIPVPQQIAGRGVPGKGLGHLTRKPDLCRILADIEVDDLSAVMAKHDQAYRIRNVAVATTNMSIAAMSVRWLCRKLRQVGEGTLGRHGRYLPTVAWLTLDAELKQFCPQGAGLWRREPRPTRSAGAA